MSNTLESKSQASSREVTLWGLAVAVGAILLPGLGIVIAGVLAFTRLRQSPGIVRWGLLALGVTILVVQLVGLLSGVGGGSFVSPINQVN